MRDVIDVSSPGQLTRRRFVRLTGGGILALPLGLSLLTEACSSVPPGSSAATSGSVAASAKLVYPTYVPFTNVPKPDLPGSPEGVEDAYTAYPSQRTSLNLSAPGNGGSLSAFVTTSVAPPKPLEQNPAWQEFNKRANINLQLNISTITDAATKLPTIIAANDLPDAIYVPPGPTGISGFPDFLAARCADLTPFLAGDAVKNYPALANYPPFLWQSAGVAYNNKIYGVPVCRSPVGNALMFQRQLADPVSRQLPKSADDFKQLLKDLTSPQAGVFGFGSSPAAALGMDSGDLFPQIFGAPNNWKLDSSGALIKDFETEEFKAALAYARDLFASGLFHPNSLGYQGRDLTNDFVSGKFVFINFSWNFDTVWRGSIVLNPSARVGVAAPFSAGGTSQPIYYLASANFGTSVLKKADPARIQEILAIYNYLASPFGTEEALFLAYGLEGQDYTWDDHGNPVPTPGGFNNAYVPWRWMAQPPHAQYSPVQTVEYAQVTHAAEQQMLSVGVTDPTLTLYAPSDGKLGPAARQAMRDGLTAIVSGRDPMSNFDQLLADWRKSAGDAIRAELTSALAASNP